MWVQWDGVVKSRALESDQFIWPPELCRQG